MISSLQDLSTFIQAIFKDKNFMNDQLFTILLKSPVPNSTYGLGISYGLGIFGENNGSYGHTGAELGYQASLFPLLLDLMG